MVKLYELWASFPLKFSIKSVLVGMLLRLLYRFFHGGATLLWRRLRWKREGHRSYRFEEQYVKLRQRAPLMFSLAFAIWFICSLIFVHIQTVGLGCFCLEITFGRLPWNTSLPWRLCAILSVKVFLCLASVIISYKWQVFGVFSIFK